MPGNYPIIDLYSDLVDTLSIASPRLWEHDDDYIAAELYEEFDDLATNLMSIGSRERLERAGLIDAELSSMCGELLSTWHELVHRWRGRPIDEHRRSKEWGDFFEMCGRVSARLAERQP